MKKPHAKALDTIPAEKRETGRKSLRQACEVEKSKLRPDKGGTVRGNYIFPFMPVS